MRVDNKLFDIVDLCEHLMGVKSFAKRHGLYLNDFNVLIGVMKLSKQPTAEQPSICANVPSLCLHLNECRSVVVLSIKRLIGVGFVIRGERMPLGQGSYYTYHLTRAGRNAIDGYYEEHYR